MSEKRYITNVIFHKVKSGESLDSLAKANGITWQQLAKFNWGTAQPDKINVNLRDHVGCTRRTASGKNYMFSDDDDPGIILIPQPWKHSDLATQLTHVIHVRPLMVVSDYEFKRSGDVAELSFTIRGRQPSKLNVRLYEHCNLTARAARQRRITAHAEDFGDKKGFFKSGCYRELKDGETLQSISALYGFDDAMQIWEHYENAVLREVRRDQGSVEKGDVVYIPQLRKNDEAIPLGPLLNVQAAREQPPIGKRYTARWEIEPNNYDPLDWHRWMPERASSIPVLLNRSLEPSPAPKSIFYFPHFAVISDKSVVIGVSPDPMYLVHDAKFKKPPETRAFRVFFADGATQGLDAGATADIFEGSQEPVTFFGAVAGSGQGVA